jgi:thiosulfate/3-mercaptopyruvate sulfurtransferase
MLDGGWPKWKSEGRETHEGAAIRSARRFVPRPRPEPLSTTEEVESKLHDVGSILFDSRTAERYRGENETIDPIAGHIPGAISAPYPDNLNPDGTFRSDEELRARFTALPGDTPADHTTFYCGSGMTAAQNILALKHVGMGDAKLYAGSWSEWITNPQHPIEK